jgi:hypothetical protein
MAEIPLRISEIATELSDKRSGTVDERISDIHSMLMSRFVRGVDPHLDAELDRIRDNGLLKAIIVQALYCNESHGSVASSPVNNTTKTSCSFGPLFLRMRRTFRRK